MTTSTEGMSRPRLATSVQRRMLLSPDLNLVSAPSLLGWAIWPCRATAGRPRLRSIRASLWTLLQVAPKTKTDLPAFSFTRYVRYTSLYLAGMNR